MPEPLYANLARDLQNAIAAGRHLPGSALPGEIELAAARGVSRATVRAALDILERDGLVERRRGARTVVLAPRPGGGFGQSVQTIAELSQYARDTRRVVSSAEGMVIDKAAANALGLEPGSRWLRIDSLRIDPARPRLPICVSQAYVAESLSGIREHLSDENTALCDILAKHFGARVEVIEQEIQGAIVTEEMAEPLGCVIGEPALRLLRRYYDASGWLFLLTIGLHPADRFAYRVRLERS